LSKTIYDIAKAAGVSIATVSRVFNQAESVKPETRKKVLKVVDEMGYHPHAYAQGLASKKKFKHRGALCRKQSMILQKQPA